MLTMTYIGIDVGKNGGLALISSDGSYVAIPWNDAEFAETMEDIYLCKDKAVAVVEKVGAMPKQGVVSMFNFGQSVGYIKGVLESFRIPYQEITPQKWKGEFGLNSDKASSAEVCRKLFPEVDLFATPKSKKPHDGMAEALLMAEYARRKL